MNHARHVCGLAIAILFVTSNAVSGETWTEINNGFPSVGAGASALALDPVSPSTLYSWTDKGIVFKSVDGAGSWKTSGGVPGVHALVIDPMNSSNIYAIARSGIVKSTNAGATWLSANTGLSPGFITSLAIDPFTPSTVYAAVTYGSLFKSTDGAESWSLLNTGLPSGSLALLNFDPVTPSTIYSVGVNGGIFKSNDGGERWTAIKAPVNVAFGDSVLSLAIDPGSPSTIYAGSFAVATGFPGNVGEGSIGKSTDGGRSWNRVNAGIPPNAFVKSLSIDPAAPSTIYGSYFGDGGWGIIKSMDRGESWRVINNGLPSGRFGGAGFLSPSVNGSRVMIDPAAPATLYAGYVDFSTGVGGVVKSTDAGETWTPANEGRTMIDITVLTVDPADTATVYAAAGTEGLFKSLDNGANWTKLVHPWPEQYIRSLVIDFVRPSTLYTWAQRTNGCVNSDENLFKSTDGGASWESAGLHRNGCDFYPSSSVVMDPTDPYTLYIGGGDEGVFAKTSNGGTSWNYVDAPGGMAVNALVIDRTNPTTLYEGNWGGVFKSIDGGANWTDTALRLGVNTLALDPANPNVVYAAAQSSFAGSSGFQGLFKSTDGGSTWVAINNGLSDLIDSGSPITTLVINPADPNILYAGTAGYGVFKSTDGGGTWNQFNDGLSSFDIRALTLSPGTSSTLYAGTRNGVFAFRLAPESEE